MGLVGSLKSSFRDDLKTELYFIESKVILLVFSCAIELAWARIFSTPKSY